MTVDTRELLDSYIASLNLPIANQNELYRLIYAVRQQDALLGNKAGHQQYFYSKRKKLEIELQSKIKTVTTEQIKTMLQQNHSDVVENGEVEYGTEEWLDILVDVCKLEGRTVTYEDLLSGSVVVDYHELEEAMDELGIESY